MSEKDRQLRSVRRLYVFVMACGWIQLGVLLLFGLLVTGVEATYQRTASDYLLIGLCAVPGLLAITGALALELRPGLAAILLVGAPVVALLCTQGSVLISPVATVDIIAALLALGVWGQKRKRSDEQSSGARRDTPSAGPPAHETDHEQWQCPSCGTANVGRTADCSLCGTPRAGSASDEDPDCRLCQMERRSNGPVHSPRACGPLTVTARWLAMISGLLQAALALFLLIVGLMGGAGLEPGDSLCVVVVLPWIGLIVTGALAVALSRAVARRALLAGLGLLLCAVLPLWWGISRLLGWGAGTTTPLAAFVLTGALLALAGTCTLWAWLCHRSRGVAPTVGEQDALTRPEPQTSAATPPRAHSAAISFGRRARWAIGLGGLLVLTAAVLCIVLIPGRGGEQEHAWPPVGFPTAPPEPASAATLEAAASLRWETMPTPEGVNFLTGVSFPDALHGWAITHDSIIGTTDGGQSWKQQHATELNDGLGLTDVRCVDPRHCWAIGEGPKGGTRLLRTSDGGNSWRKSFPAPAAYATSVGGGDITFVDVRHGWISTPWKGDVYATSDGGGHWRRQLAADGDHNYGGIAFADARHGWVLRGARERAAAILHTADGGETWEVQLESETRRSFDDVFCIDARHAWVVGLYEILSTKDGGRTWTPSKGWDLCFTTVSFADDLHGWVGGMDIYETRMVILATGDGGRTWAEAWSTSAEEGGDLGQITDLLALSPVSVLAVGGGLMDADGTSGAMLVGRSTAKAKTP